MTQNICSSIRKKHGIEIFLDMIVTSNGKWNFDDLYLNINKLDLNIYFIVHIHDYSMQS